MFNQMTISQAQEQLPDLPRALQSNPAIITKDGSPVLIAFSVENFLSLMETAEILADVELMENLAQGMQQADRGDCFDLDTIEAELSL